MEIYNSAMRRMIRIAYNVMTPLIGKGYNKETTKTLIILGFVKAGFTPLEIDYYFEECEKVNKANNREVL
jgi:hypothetical protein